MASLPKTIRQSELLGRLVLLCDSMQEAGHVDSVWMHPPVHRVFGCICASGLLGRKKSAFNLPQLHAIGEDGLLVNSAPVPTDAQKVRQIESLLGYEVWTDSGEKVGHITDYVFDTQTGAIQAYLFTSHPLGALTDGLYKMTPRQMLSYGDRRIRVRNQVLTAPELYKPGLKQKIVTVGEAVRETAEEEWRSLTEQALNWRELALEQWQALTAQAKTKAIPLSEQAKEKTQSFTQRAKEQGQGLVDRLRDQTRSLADQLRTELDDTWAKQPEDTAASTPSPGEYHWDFQASHSDFEDEFNDWDEAGCEDSTKTPDPDFEDEDEDGWDTWDLDETPTPKAPDPPQPSPEPPSEESRHGQSTSAAVAPQPSSAEELPSASVPGSAPLITELQESESADGAIASPVAAAPPLPTDPIPPEDLDDDDPWI